MSSPRCSLGFASLARSTLKVSLNSYKALPTPTLHHPTANRIIKATVAASKYPPQRREVHQGYEHALDDARGSPHKHSPPRINIELAERYHEQANNTDENEEGAAPETEPEHPRRSKQADQRHGPP